MTRRPVPPNSLRMRHSKTTTLKPPGLDHGRVERDSMGSVIVPVEAYYGAQTARALDNFPISGIRFSRSFIRAIGLIKEASAKTNASLGLLSEAKARAIARAASEVKAGRWDKQFPLDIFQTGSGTSSNMNANEVIAHRASEILRGDRVSRDIHPNDQVNLGQSSNDVIPTAIHVAAIEEIQKKLLPGLDRLLKAFHHKAREFDRIVKIGRTHLQDATPIRLGQEFSGYARQIELAIQRARHAQSVLAELALGGTAVGTGLNTHPQFASRVIKLLAKEIGYPVREAENHFEAQAAQDAVVEASGCLRTIAVSMMKIANDLRWMGSGPRCGLGEIYLPETQPGSSMMPGKVNPVIAESVTMVATQVIGNDMTITVAGQAGNFELLVMLPVMAHNLLQSIDLLATSAENLSRRCVEGLTANKSICEALVEKSLAMTTALVPALGYESAAALAKQSFTTGKTVRELVHRRKDLPESTIHKLLDPWRMTEPSGFHKRSVRTRSHSGKTARRR